MGRLVTRLSKGLAQVTLLGRQLDARAAGGRAFRAVLAGRPNAGKSSLFNALGGSAAALVSPQPGTTRDYLRKRLDFNGTVIELIDTAGWQPPRDEMPTADRALLVPPHPGDPTSG